ncbi:MAG: N-acetyl-L-ornithine deacetylase ArgE [Alphaproteobacteria bacterium]
MEDTPDPRRVSPPDFPELHDIDAFNKRLKAAFDRVSKIRPYKMESLGQVGGRDIFLLSPVEPIEGKPNILTAGGFHGEEPGGPWGIIEFLETADEETLKSVNHSFLPLVNPTGFERGVRFNIHGENPNRGFVAEYIDAAEEEDAEWTNRGPSAEGKILLKHGAKLVELARDGFTSQHEDDGLNEGFIFINEQGPMPSPTATALLDTIQKHFPLIPDGGKNELEGSPIKDGMWVNGMDSSFETWMLQQGVPRTITTETPALEPARDRVDCNRGLVKAFAEVTVKICAKPAENAPKEGPVKIKKKPPGPKP